MTAIPARYAPSLRRLHWLMALLVLAAYLLIEQRGLFARGTAERAAMVQGHFWAGLSVFAFALWRVALRRRHGVPAAMPAPPAWSRVLAGLLHAALYLFFIAMPLLGLATAWTDGKPLSIPFTGIALPALLPQDEVLAHSLEELHGTIGEVFYWIIGLHVLAAIWHQAVRRDDGLRRML